MDPMPLLFFFILILVSNNSRAEDVQDGLTWNIREIPHIVTSDVVQLSSPKFGAEPKMERFGFCGIECQKHLPPPTLNDLENYLSFETVYDNGTRTMTKVNVESWLPKQIIQSNLSVKHNVRRKRQVFGTDSRFSISDKHFITNYPFSTAVKLSSGCSGILISPKHVLTAAHCIHDGTDYIKNAKKLRVGLLKIRTKRGGKRRKGQKKNRGVTPDDEDTPINSGKKQRRKSVQKRSAADGKEKSTSSGRGKGSASGNPSFQWTRVKAIQIPKGWLRDVSKNMTLDYDYAVLEIKRAQKKYMDLGISPEVDKMPKSRVHFSGFDEDRPGQLVYRFCSVSQESSDLFYQYCDADPGSSGSGIYIRVKEPNKKKWNRKIIAIYSGHQWMDVGDEQQDYNVAVRITPMKYAQICLWVHGKNADCSQG